MTPVPIVTVITMFWGISASSFSVAVRPVKVTVPVRDTVVSC